jgi:hypothetical protein
MDAPPNPQANISCRDAGFFFLRILKRWNEFAREKHFSPHDKKKANQMMRNELRNWESVVVEEGLW